MVDARAVRLQVLGEHTSGLYAGEIWQTGIHFVEGDAGGVFPSAIREALPTFSVSPIGQSTEDANFQMDWAWKGDSKLTQQNQIGIANAAVAWVNSLKALFTTNMRMTAVKLVAQEAGGRTISGGNMFYLKSPVAGTAAATSQQPAQLAVVCSLRTGARGPGGRGRMYLPLLGAAANGGGVPSATRTTVLAQTAAFVEAVRGIGPLAAVVNTAKQQYSALAYLEVGDLYDTQRRRVNGVRESYVSQTVNL